MNKIRLYSGKFVDPLNLQIEDIQIEDIAHSLSMQCRFGGHVRTHYSIAQHSIRVASLLHDDFKLEGLLHDASEAYLLDLPKPIKNRLPDYIAAENRIQELIAKKWNLSYPFPKSVHDADHQAFQEEWENVVISDNWPNTVSYSLVEAEFLMKFYEITKTSKNGN